MLNFGSADTVSDGDGATADALAVGDEALSIAAAETEGAATGTDAEGVEAADEAGAAHPASNSAEADSRIIFFFKAFPMVSGWLQDCLLRRV